MAQTKAVGTILFANGEVNIIGANGRQRPARRGDGLHAGERIVTGEGALGQVRMGDGALIGIRAASALEFLPLTAGGDAGAQRLSLRGGNVRVLNLVGETQATGRPYLLRTPHGDLRLSDSDAQAVIPAQVDDGASRTFFKLNRGTATAAGRSGSAVNLAPGDSVAVQPAGVERLAALSSNAVPGPTRSVQTSTDPLSRRSAAATPIESAGGLRPGGLGVGPLQDSLPPAPAAGRYAGLSLQPMLGLVSPPPLRVEDRVTGNLSPTTQIDTRVPPIQQTAVLERRLPGVAITDPRIASALPTNLSLSRDAIQVLGAVSLNVQPTLSDNSLLRGGTGSTPSRTTAPAEPLPTGSVAVDGLRLTTRPLTGTGSGGTLINISGGSLGSIRDSNPTLGPRRR